MRRSKDSVDDRINNIEDRLLKSLAMIAEKMEQMESRHEQEKKELREGMEKLEIIIHEQGVLYSKRVKELGGDW